MHLGLVPILLLLPWYLGYVPWVFTSAFPSGGILYPWLVIHFRGFPWTEVDSFILRHSPKILEPLSQSSGPPLALSGRGAFGPVAAFSDRSGHRSVFIWYRHRLPESKASEPGIV